MAEICRKVGFSQDAARLPIIVFAMAAVGAGSTAGGTSLGPRMLPPSSFSLAQNKPPRASRRALKGLTKDLVRSGRFIVSSDNTWTERSSAGPHPALRAQNAAAASLDKVRMGSRQS